MTEHREAPIDHVQSPGTDQYCVKPAPGLPDPHWAGQAHPGATKVATNRGTRSFDVDRLEDESLSRGLAAREEDYAGRFARRSAREPVSGVGQCASPTGRFPFAQTRADRDSPVAERARLARRRSADVRDLPSVPASPRPRVPWGQPVASPVAAVALGFGRRHKRAPARKRRLLTSGLPESTRQAALRSGGCGALGWRSCRVRPDRTACGSTKVRGRRRSSAHQGPRRGRRPSRRCRGRRH